MLTRWLGVVAVLGAELVATASAEAEVPASEASPEASPPPDGTPAHRVLVMPFVGVQQYMTGDYAMYADVGLRLGAVVGWRLNQVFSLNVEGLVDKLSMGPPVNVVDPWIREVAFSPLARVTKDGVEFVVGPKAGLWWLTNDTVYRSRGWALGVNAGVLLSTWMGMSWGVLIGYETRQTTRACAGAPCIEFRDEEQSLGFSAAALY